MNDRGAIRRAVTNLLKEVTKWKEENIPTEIELQAARFKFVEKKQLLEAADRQFLEGLKDEELESEQEQIELYEDKLFLIRAVLEKFEKSSSTPQVDSQQAEPKKASIRLPKLELPQFNGDITKFSAFWSQFTFAVHDNPALSKVDKFCYLLNQLAGTAKNAIIGLSLSETNYDVAIKILRSRFGQTDAAAQQHLLKLSDASSVRDLSNIIALRKLYDHLNSHVCALDALGIDMSSYSMTLYPLLNRLVPSDMMIEFVRRSDNSSGNENNSNSNDSSSSSTVGTCAMADTYATKCRKFMLFFEKELVCREECNFLNNLSIDSTNNTRSSSNQYSCNRNQPNRVINKRLPNTTTSFTTFSPNAERSNRQNCIFCRETHSPVHCTATRTTEQLRRAIIAHRRCFRCLAMSHTSRHCMSNVRCAICQQRHLTRLHEANVLPSSSTAVANGQPIVSNPRRVNAPSSAEAASSSSVNSCQLTSNNGTKLVLQTVGAYVQGSTTSFDNFVRILFDTGSHRTFISTSFAESLGLEKVGVSVFNIKTFASAAPQEHRCNQYRVRLKNRYTNSELVIHAYGIENLGCQLSTRLDNDIDRKIRKLGICLTDSYMTNNSFDNASVDIIIGSDCYNRLVTGRSVVIDKDLVAYETKLGWTLLGAIAGKADVSASLVACNNVVVSDLNALWDLDHIGIVDNQTRKDTIEFEDFKDKIAFQDGRYVVSLPFDPSVPIEDMESNYDVALAGLRRLEKKLEQNVPSKFLEYDQAMRAYVDENHAERVNDPFEQTPNAIYYMPHRPVFREDKETTKLRVVFNCSSHSKESISLNDCLLPGPNLNPDLVSLLLNIRHKRIAVCADIRKAFLQVVIEPAHRDLLRYLWFDPETDQITHFRMKTLPFGVTSSPFILSAVLRHHLEQHSDSYPNTVELLKNSFYVDDLLTGIDDIGDGKRFVEESSSLLSMAGMELRKWRTNDKELERFIREYSPSESGQVDDQCSELFKVLGIGWDTENDVFHIDIRNTLDFVGSCSTTKRQLLQASARLFDPLGFIAPFTLTMRCILQRLWKLGANWDDPILDEQVIAAWETWKQGLALMSILSLPRQFGHSLNRVVTRELHIFCDASTEAYAASVYIRLEDDEGNISIDLVIAKTRVAPIQRVTLPRLELLAALVGARLATYVRSQMNIEIQCVNFWTDSMIALYWIKGDPSRWKQFVSNRVKEIQSSSDPANWNYCPTESNPADLATRSGVTAHRLIVSDQWWHGPSWLSKPADEWPCTPLVGNNQHLDVENEARIVVANLCVSVGQSSVVDIERFGEYQRLLRTAVYVLRFIDRIKRTEVCSGTVTAAELEKAELTLIKQVQRSCFSTEMEHLVRSATLPETSVIKQFAPFLDEHGVLRVGGRLQNSTLPTSLKHPIILPSKNPFTRLLIIWEHRRLNHAGTTMTLSSLRDKYWIIRGRQFIKTLISRCVHCRKLYSRPGNQPTAPLPRDRIEFSTPFETTGIDFAGPLYVRRTKTAYEKAYVAIFTCAVTRAVHFELVTGLTTRHWLLSFRRFVSRRGVPATIYSDNAQSFQRASAELSRLWNCIKNPEFQDFVAIKQIRWKFIVPRAAWWGGFYERIVRSLKQCLRSSIGTARLGYEELETTLIEAEAVINSRPLCQVSSDTVTEEALSPAHFLVGQPLTRLPNAKVAAEEPSSNREVLTRRHTHRRLVFEQFRNKWIKNYLLELRSFHTVSNQHARQCAEGDVVLIHDDNKKRIFWRVGRIEETHVGRDGRARSFTIKLANGNQIRRPCQLIYPLEVVD